MKKKHKITLLVIGIFLVLSLMISSSYALWVFNVSQESTNVLVSDCFEIRFTSGSNAINLTNSFPMKDGEGVYTIPYEFTIRNICNHASDIEINIETLNVSQIAGENLRVDVNGHIHTYGIDNYVTPSLDNAVSAARFYTDTVAAGDSKKYNLRFWIKEDANSVDVADKLYSSKITVRATAINNYSEATMISGSEFNKAIKGLSGDANPSIYSTNTSIMDIKRSLTAPKESDNTVLVSVSASPKPVYAWFDEGIIYLYSEANMIYMNSSAAYMFRNLTKVVSIDVSMFNTSKVRSMREMFNGVESLVELDLSHFDTSNVNDMTSMFFQARKLANLDISGFNTAKVTNMTNMFYQLNAVRVLDVSHFNTSNVRNMNFMFSGVHSVSLIDVSHFDTQKVTNMNNMFAGMSKVENIDVSHFDTSNVTDMHSMFYGMRSLTAIDLSNFDTSKVTDMSSMFNYTSNLVSLDLSNFDTSKVTNMNSMFYGDDKLINLNLSGFDTTNVINMGSMFTNASALEVVDLVDFDTQNVTNMRGMFYNIPNLKTVYVSSKWTTDSVTDSNEMFLYDYNIVGGLGTVYNRAHVDKEYARVDDPANGKPGYFTLKTS